MRSSAGRTSSSSTRDSNNNRYSHLLLLLIVGCSLVIARLLFYPLRAGGVGIAGIRADGPTMTDDAIMRMAHRAAHPVPHNITKVSR